MYVLVYVLFMNEFVLIDILGMGWGIFWDYGEIEIKFNRFIGICMFKVLGIGQNFDYEIYNGICKDLY